MSTTEFQTHLELEHWGGTTESPSALIINPAASTLKLVAAAKARTQAISEGLTAWQMVEETSATIEEVIRPFNHLAEEVALLLEAVASRFQAEQRGSPS